ncbi:hypothetical protein AVEN_118853-1 [Araneus ventricosus]|uniref:Uncharacterized protein n=1 Tax=Araneus ventricosus TaxID=182803 RepID=A0A4Y2WLH2_ARAVE|nr:hypothetical protein AVEN_118853-1 [Araneus ventricosus]
MGKWMGGQSKNFGKLGVGNCVAPRWIPIAGPRAPSQSREFIFDKLRNLIYMGKQALVEFLKKKVVACNRLVPCWGVCTGWLGEVVRGRDIALCCIVERGSYFSADTAIIAMQAETFQIFWERAMTSDKLCELARPVVAFVAYLWDCVERPYSCFLQNPFHLARALPLSSFLALLLGSRIRYWGTSSSSIADLASVSAISLPMWPTCALIQPSLMC